jgi:hypothetical protein
VLKVEKEMTKSVTGSVAQVARAKGTINMTLYETALFWVEKGFSVIPINYYSKKPRIKSWEPYKNQLPTDFELRQWFPSEMRNVGLITGNGLVVIDFDVMDVFNFWFSLFPLNTYMVKTRRGIHVYLKTKQPAKNYHSDLLDIKAERGYVLIPPSIHPSGYQYQVYQDAPILQIEKLEDVLPPEFTPEPEKTVTCTEQTTIEIDPWALADSAVDLEMGVVKKIRDQVSLLSIIGGAEESSRDGRWYKTLCPFHEDYTPSFWIDTQRGICGCWKCNIKEMDVLDLYARLHNISNTQAIQELSKKL